MAEGDVCDEVFCMAGEEFVGGCVVPGDVVDIQVAVGQSPGHHNMRYGPRDLADSQG